MMDLSQMELVFIITSSLHYFTHYYGYCFMLLRVITKSSLHIFTFSKLLPIVTSLLRMAKLYNNDFIIHTLIVSIILPLLPIITVITYYCVFEIGQLPDALGAACLT